MPCRCRVGPRGSATWPCVPRCIHVVPCGNKTTFCLYFIYFNRLKIEINLEKIRKKIPKNRKFITFNI